MKSGGRKGEYVGRGGHLWMRGIERDWILLKSHMTTCISQTEGGRGREREGEREGESNGQRERERERRERKRERG